MLEPQVLRMLAGPKGAIEAPAGTGKTEQIVVTAAKTPGRWLILTHTVAGVEAIRRRLKKYSVPDTKAHVETISAWAHRWARAFPSSAGLPANWSIKGSNWSIAHHAGAQLVESGAVASVLKASYDGVLVDEYQDCSGSQHRLVEALSKFLRCYVFGDPLQAIFGFSKVDLIVDWHSQTLSVFPLAGQLAIPHRWNAVGSGVLGAWLLDFRRQIEAGHIDLSGAPAGLQWTKCERRLPVNELGRLCTVSGYPAGHTTAVLDSSVDAVRRSNLAKAIGGTTVEPVSGRCERDFYASLSILSGLDRVAAVLNLASTVFVGADAAAKRKRVESLISNPGRQMNPPTPAEMALCGVGRGPALASVLDALQCIENETGVTATRPELLYAVKATLRLCADSPALALEDATWQVANSRRERGRVVRNRSVGSTLLVKGLEFDHVVITPEACKTKFDWYVALTRATRSIRVLSPHQSFDMSN
ncbi:UvrD-helicase domain-containing protein [Cupriavidus sp. D39]|uniref:UvrD-helicase domain-containing protein n=1 Tax=Cupriavidus sp. D39 TaxID=2997877 RepID=UPI003B632986